MGFVPCIELLLVFIFSNALIHFGSSVVLYEYRIEINNGSNNMSLVTQCTTNGDPVGVTTIKPGTLQSFRCPWIIKKRSFATCNMNLGKLHGRFDLFDSDRDLKRCKDKECLWDVNESGLFLALGGLEVLQYRWQ